MCDFGPRDAAGPVAQPLDGPFVAALAAIARDRSARVVAGMFERSDDPERPYNTLVALARTAHWPAPTGRRTSTTPSATGSPTV